MRKNISSKGFTRLLCASPALVRKGRARAGFTFIELIITLAVIAISFLPLMRMFSASLEQVHISNDLTTARYLGQEGMEKVKNLSFTKTQLLNLGNVWEPPLGKPPVELNKRKWRILRATVAGSDPLEIHIKVYQVGSSSGNMLSGKPVVELATLIEDLDWVPSE